MPRPGFLALSRATAYRLVVLVGLPAVFAATVFFMSTRPAPGPAASGQGEGDLALFRAVVNGQRDGRSYYEVYGAESRARGYPTKSVFNWRQPLLLEALPLPPYWISLALFIALGAGIVVQAHFLLRRELLYVLTVINAAAIVAVPGEVYFTEGWAGLCLGLSAIAYARRRETTGAGWALLALFIRELAGPYCLIAALIALSRKRWRELAVWAGGAVAYGIYFGAHARQAMQHVLPGDLGHGHSWLYGGGLPFVLRVWKMNGLFAAVPVPIFALSIAAAAAAWWARTMPLHVRVSVLMYSVLFLFVGLPFNTYWGELIAPLVALWLAYAPAGLERLWTLAELPRSLPVLPLNRAEGLS